MLKSLQGAASDGEGMLQQSLAQRERLAHLRRLRGLHARLLGSGIPLQGSEQLAQSMALLFRDCLSNSKDKRRVPRAAELAHRLYDQGERNAPAARPLACRAGCDSCCHAFVSVLAPEAFLIAETLKQRSGSPSADDFKLRARSLRGRNQLARASGEKSPCAALEQHLCSVHAKRPLACRKHNSFSLEACLAAFDGKNVPIPSHGAHLTLGTTCSVAFRAGLKSLGLSFQLYELSDAVSTILDTDDALARWSGGEDVLAGVQTDTSTPLHLSRAIAGLAAAIA